MKVSVLIGTRNRTTPLLRCLESVEKQNLRPHEILVLDDGSDRVRVSDVLRDAGVRNVRALRSDKPLGVAGGRNLLLSQASGDVFFILDDDAYLDSPEGLHRLNRAFLDHPKAGIVATRIVDHRYAEARILAPFSMSTRRRSPRVTGESQLVSYFLGGGHAIRRELYAKIGGYNDRFVYGEEELELSYRAIQTGFEIFYAADVIVHHYPMPSVLVSADRPRSELFYHVRNRVFLAKTYLPARYIGPYLAIWLARYAAISLRNGGLPDVISGLVDALRALPQHLRKPLTSDSLSYLRRHHGRLWF
jgi:GT2 family glycosyltransferase